MQYVPLLPIRLCAEFYSYPVWCSLLLMSGVTPLNVLIDYGKLSVFILGNDMLPLTSLYKCLKYSRHEHFFEYSHQCITYRAYLIYSLFSVCMNKIYIYSFLQETRL
jgi:hypothetical protein